MVESGGVLGKGRIRASTEKLSLCVEKNGSIRASIEKMVESGPVPGKERFRASTEKLSICVPENGRIRASLEKW